MTPRRTRVAPALWVRAAPGIFDARSSTMTSLPVSAKRSLQLEENALGVVASDEHVEPGAKRIGERRELRIADPAIHDPELLALTARDGSGHVRPEVRRERAHDELRRPLG